MKNLWIAKYLLIVVLSFITKDVPVFQIWIVGTTTELILYGVFHLQVISKPMKDLIHWMQPADADIETKKAVTKTVR